VVFKAVRVSKMLIDRLFCFFDRIVVLWLKRGFVSELRGVFVRKFKLMTTEYLIEDRMTAGFSYTGSYVKSFHEHTLNIPFGWITGSRARVNRSITMLIANK
jgi:hypothetical protein